MKDIKVWSPLVVISHHLKSQQQGHWSPLPLDRRFWGNFTLIVGMKNKVGFTIVTVPLMYSFKFFKRDLAEVSIPSRKLELDLYENRQHFIKIGRLSP